MLALATSPFQCRGWRCCPLGMHSDMSWFAFALVVLGVWLAIKVVDALLKLAFWCLALVAACWFLAPLAGWSWPF